MVESLRIPAGVRRVIGFGLTPVSAGRTIPRCFMNLSEFDYDLPDELIAQYPAAQRTDSRLLVPNSGLDEFRDMRFHELGTLLCPGDLLVVNDTRVLPARVMAAKPSGGKVEIMLERIRDDCTAIVQLRANKPIRDNQPLEVKGRRLGVEGREQGFYILRTLDGRSMSALFEDHGRLPLPPYVSRTVEAQDEKRYQTVYAEHPGAVAAPTAGLHFDQALIDSITSAGVRWAKVTLHVGAGTFQPIRNENVLTHRMHREWVEVDEATCLKIAATVESGARVVAVGTTVVRALESAAANGTLEPFAGDTDLYVTPGFEFRVVDALVTNFHLPRSSLLILVSAFAGKERVLAAYRHAVALGYRFFSYGDAMFLEKSR